LIPESLPRPESTGSRIETYAKLLDKLAQTKFSDLKPDVRENILAFYQDPSAPNFTKKKRDKWTKFSRSWIS